MWQDKYTKEDLLPIERTDLGFTQRSQWRQPDRLHEEVVELESPLAAVVAAGTHVYTFVLLGDQNAGKSTFLHSFTCHLDSQFLLLNSLLPALSSSFVNTRFLAPGQSAADARDEPPFLDTDLARGTLVLTADDFAFFVVENELDESLVTSAPPGTVYFAIQFIEFGGDHLDQLMDPALIPSPAVADIVAQSRALLANCHKAVYFANGQTLVRDGRFSADALAMLGRRFDFLSTVLPANVSVMVHISRPPVISSLAGLSELAQSTAAAGFASPDVSDLAVRTVNNPSLLCAAPVLERTLRGQSTLRGWAFAKECTVSQRDHLLEDGALAPQAIISTLVDMFRAGMIHSEAPPEQFVARHILQCFKEPLFRLDEEDDTFSLWLDAQMFAEYLDECEGFTEVPVTSILQSFEPVVRRLAAAHLGLVHAGQNLAAIDLILSVDETLYSLPAATAFEASGPVQFRFPYSDSFLEVVSFLFSPNVSPDLWLSPDVFAEHTNPALCQQLLEASDSIVAELAVRTGQLPANSQRWRWLVEEWWLAQCLLSGTPADSPARFSLALPISLAAWLAAAPALPLQPVSVSSENRAAVVLALTLVAADA
eukprot:m.303811 g.303811  ORF g.303811 m.303811 type:complete len:597 (-) comp16243_c0_seq1:49-1839(-)